MDAPLATLGVLLLGAVLGALLIWSWRVSERQRDQAPPQPEPVIPEAVASVLAVLRSSAVLVGDDEAVLDASAPARALGLVRQDRLVPDDLIEAVRAVRRDGQIRELELVLRSRTPTQSTHVVSARVAPLGVLVLVLAEDRTREHQVESIRRDFVANVSHELKTPVGALNLLAEATEQAAEDPDAVRRFAGRMQAETERLTRLVQQIIELSRLQGDELVVEPTAVGVDTVVRAALERVRTDADARGIALVTRVEPGLTVTGRPDQIQVAVANLIENAVAYSDDGGRVAVMAARSGWQVSVTVSDQGVGIPPSELDRIFERFYRVDPARSRATGGTGLGLSIAKHIAASHGGEITVWSVEDEGSSFTLRLPAADGTRRPAAPPAAATPAPIREEAPS